MRNLKEGFVFPLPCFFFDLFETFLEFLPGARGSRGGEVGVSRRKRVKVLNPRGRRYKEPMSTLLVHFAAGFSKIK